VYINTFLRAEIDFFLFIEIIGVKNCPNWPKKPKNGQK